MLSNRMICVQGMMLALAFAWPKGAGAAPTPGDVLPPPAPGVMDIHHINTGEGSAAFLVLPDRTTLLIDCGSNQDTARLPRFKAPRRPTIRACLENGSLAIFEK